MCIALINCCTRAWTTSSALHQDAMHASGLDQARDHQIADLAILSFRRGLWSIEAAADSVSYTGVVSARLSESVARTVREGPSMKTDVTHVEHQAEKPSFLAAAAAPRLQRERGAHSACASAHAHQGHSAYAHQGHSTQRSQRTHTHQGHSAYAHQGHNARTPRSWRIRTPRSQRAHTKVMAHHKG